MGEQKIINANNTFAIEIYSKLKINDFLKELIM